MKTLLALTLTLTALGTNAQTEIAKPAPDLEKAIAYPLKDAKTGKMMTLQDLAGKYKAIYIDSYASWCGDCKRALPEVLKLNRALKDEGVLVIGLDVWDKWDKMQEHRSANKLPYLVLHDPEETGGKGITALFGITNIPTVVILDGKTLKQKGFFIDEKAVHLDDEMQVLQELGVKATR